MEKCCCKRKSASMLFEKEKQNPDRIGSLREACVFPSAFIFSPSGRIRSELVSFI